VRLGLRERLVALEQLLQDAGHRPRLPLKEAYTSKSLARTLTDLALMGGAEKVMTAACQSVDVRSSIVRAFRRDLYGALPASVEPGDAMGRLKS
jgi:hypothetical protein